MHHTYQRAGMNNSWLQRYAEPQKGVLGIVWAARNNTWLLIKLTPKGLVFSFSFLFLGHSFIVIHLEQPWIGLYRVSHLFQIFVSGLECPAETFPEVRSSHIKS